MAGIRRSTRIYIGLVTLAAALLLISSVSVFPHAWVLNDLFVAAGLAILMILATAYQLRVSRDTSVTIDTSIILAAILLLDPTLAMLVASTSLVADLCITHLPWPKMIFATSQVIVQAGSGSLFLYAIGWDRTNVTFDSFEIIAMVLAAGTLIVTVNSILVGTVIGLQSRQPVVRQWWETVHSRVAEEMALLGLGVLGTALVDMHVWTIPLLVVPGAIIHRSVERTSQLQLQTIEAMSSLADIVDSRDPYTAGHSVRVADYARQLAIALRLEPEDVDAIEQAARVHDIGNMTIDSNVAAKPGSLDDDAWQQIKAHPLTGVEVLRRFPLFSGAADYVLYHHEHFDSSGYPSGLAGEQIPLGARVVAVAEAFDAMTHARPYRPTLDPSAVKAELQRQRGAQWDPTVVDALLSLIASGEIVLPQDAARATRAANLSGALSRLRGSASGTDG